MLFAGKKTQKTCSYDYNKKSKYMYKNKIKIKQDYKHKIEFNLFNCFSGNHVYKHLFKIILEIKIN